ncbi:MAG: sensor histidine kinase [Phycisphaeraceae bacterium]|nr:MAG: sensor histidine kinase [Phycisphaeraceae bacterium]
MHRGLSLANKCQLLFGGAVILIVLAALLVPWNRLTVLVDDLHREQHRELVRLVRENLLITDSKLSATDTDSDSEQELSIRYLEWSQLQDDQEFSEFEQQAIRFFQAREPDAPRRSNEFGEAFWRDDLRIYRYAHPIPASEDRGDGVVFIEQRSSDAARLVMINRIYLIISGIGAGVLAWMVFYFITNRIILGPVRSLRETADRVKSGSMHVRADIHTRDEFEELSDAFNAMLETLTSQQGQLRAVNRSLDLKLTELAERNVALYEAARLKGEFLASVSHELRTPLNSIIGFAEILQEIAQSEADESPDIANNPKMAKRRRYLDHIVTSGRRLLEMINELLTMAKIEAGMIDLQIQQMSVTDTCEGLMALIRPLADKKSIKLILQLQTSTGGRFTAQPDEARFDPVTTDPSKFQQIVFNFLSNAVKFTPENGEVTLRAERIQGSDGEERLRVSVLDTGPGIPPDKHMAIFEKFSQLDTGHTREHAGTGLGLAIANEFASMIGGEIQLVSEIGRGSMFSLIVPMVLDLEAQKSLQSTRDETELPQSADRPLKMSDG